MNSPVSAAIRAQNPDIDTAWHTIAWWQQTCDYWHKQAEDARARLAATEAQLRAALEESA